MNKMLILVEDYFNFYFFLNEIMLKIFLESWRQCQRKYSFSFLWLDIKVCCEKQVRKVVHVTIYSVFDNAYVGFNQKQKWCWWNLYHIHYFWSFINIQWQTNDDEPFFPINCNWWCPITISLLHYSNTHTHILIRILKYCLWQMAI